LWSIPSRTSRAACVLVTANDYPAGSTFPVHAHRRASSRSPPAVRSAWRRPKVGGSFPLGEPAGYPPGVAHEIVMSGSVTMLNAFMSLDEASASRMPDHCCVYGISALLKQLLEEAIDLPAIYDIDGRAGKLMNLLIAEIASMPRLARACRRLFDAPSIAIGLDMMATASA
ncbi:MAG: hypothetical protein CBARDCOR_6957, partial [uncultured Caballeronia sp.]